MLTFCIEPATVTPRNSVHGHLYTREWVLAQDTMVVLIMVMGDFAGRLST